jgi:hypothetical protein
MLAKSFQPKRVGSASDVTEVHRVILAPHNLYVRFEPRAAGGRAR